MRISTQYKVAIIGFSIALIVITASIILTSESIASTRSQESLVDNIAKGAGDLAYASNDYVVYHGEQQLNEWQAGYASLSQGIANLKANTPEQKRLIQEIQVSQQEMGTIFKNIRSLVETSNQSETASAIQISWSGMSGHTQTITARANQLSQLLRAQADQLILENFLLIGAIVGAFAIFLLVIYVQTFQRTLKSLSELETGAAIIGSGNLYYRLMEGKADEIGQLSKAFNQMTSNLKSVTASKADLEREMIERQKTQEALRASEQRWATTLASIGDAVIATDTSGTVTFINGEAQELTGWTLSQALHKPVKSILNIVNEQTRLEVESPIDRVLKEGLVVGLANHTVLIRKDNTEIPIDDSGAPIKDSAGNITGVVLIFRDITERKKAEETLLQRTEELEQTQKKLEENACMLEEYSTQMEELAKQRLEKLKDSERLAAVGATAGMVGHDIRNPLQAITGDLYLAKSEATDLPECDQKSAILESLEETQKNVDYINKIVQDLQDYARPLNPRAEESDLKEIIEKSVTKNGVPSNVKVTVRVTDEARKVHADSYYLNRILYNLVTNAVQAMPQGGKLVISAQRDANDIALNVKDTGIGIPKEVQNKLFTVMFTTKSKGQGFGLPVVKRMTESLGGTITFESQEGKGTTFTIRIPTQNSNQ